MKLIGISVKQFRQDNSSRGCATDDTGVSKEYIVPLVVGKVNDAPPYAKYLNNNLNIMVIKDAEVVFKFKGEVISLKNKEKYNYHEEYEISNEGIIRYGMLTTVFELTYGEEPSKEVMEEIFDDIMEKSDNQEYEEALEGLHKLIGMKLSSQLFHEVVEHRIDEIELNNNLKQSYLNNQVAELAMQEIKEAIKMPDKQKVEVYRILSDTFSDLQNYERAEACLRAALELTEDEGKKEAILIQFYRVGLNRLADVEAYVCGFFYNGRDKLMDLKGKARENMHTVHYDPVEQSKEYLDVILDVEDKIVRKIGKDNKEGYNLQYWRVKSEILKEEYKIEWKSPRFMNPNKRF